MAAVSCASYDHTLDPFDRVDLIRATGNAKRSLVEGDKIRIRYGIAEGEKRWCRFVRFNSDGWVIVSNYPEPLHAIFIDRMRGKRVKFRKGPFNR